MSPDTAFVDTSRHRRRIAWRGLAGATAITTAVGIAILGASPASAAGSVLSVNDAAALTSAFGRASAGATVTASLTGDLTIPDGKFTLAGGSLTIDLNEHELMVTAPAGQPALTVKAGGSLRVEGGKVATFIGGNGANGADASLPARSDAGAGATGTAASPDGGAGRAGTVPGQRGGPGGAGFGATDAVGGAGGNGGNGGIGGAGGTGGSGGPSTYTVAPPDPFVGATGGDGGNGGNGIDGRDATNGGAGIVIAGVVTVSGARLIGAGGAGGNGGNAGPGAFGGTGGFGGDLIVTGGAPTDASRGGTGGNGGHGGNGGAGGNGGTGIDLQHGLLFTGSAPRSEVSQYGGPGGAGGSSGAGGSGGNGGAAGQTVVDGNASAPDPAYSGAAGRDGAAGTPGASGQDGYNLDDTADALLGWEVAADGTTAAPSSGVVVFHANNGTESAWVLRDSRGIGGRISTIGAMNAIFSHGNIAFPSYAGHTLTGWASDADGHGGLLPGSTGLEVPEVGVVELYAQWKIASAVTPTAPPTTTPTTQSLASTGSDIGGWLVLSILLGVVGMATIFLGRKHAGRS